MMRASSGGFIPTMVSGSGITRFLGGGSGPSIAMRPARIEMRRCQSTTSMRTYRADTGSANNTFSTSLYAVLPTNSLPSSTYS